MFGASPQVRILSPVPQTETKGPLTITGTCLTGVAVALKGDVVAPIEVPCVERAFEGVVELSDVDGPKTVSASQTDSFSQTGGDNRSFVRDTTAPAVEITAPVANQPVRNSVVVSGSCETGKSLEFAVSTQLHMSSCANGVFAATVPLTVADGPWDLSISQKDNVGNTTTRIVAIRKDTTPLLTVVSPLMNSQVRSPVTISGGCEVGVEIKLGGTGLLAPMTAQCAAAGNYSVNAALSANDGSKVIAVEQTDKVGVKTTITLNVVRSDTAPAVAITMPNANTAGKDSLTISGTCENNTPISISGTGVAAPSTATCVNTAFTANVFFSAGDGNKIVTVAQTNGVGVTGMNSRSFVRDTTAPVVTIASPLANTETKTTIALVGACETGLPVRIAGTGVTTATSVVCNAGQYSSTITLSINDGQKVVEVSQTDSVGNIGQVARTFVRDNIAPVIMITLPMAGASAETAIQISGTCEGNYAVQVAGTGVQSPMTTTCAANAFSANVLFTANDGNKVVEVAQTDTAGNRGTNVKTFVRSTPPPDGAMLYSQNCATCHGQLAGSEKRGRTAAQITQSIADIASMKFLSVLTQVQIQAIATALSGAATPTTPISAKVSDYGAVLGDRTHMASLFSDVFKAPAAPTPADATITGVIQQHVKERIAALGGPCTVYDADCLFSEKDTSLMVTASPTPSPSRKGYTTRACEEILQLDVGVSNALMNAGLTTASIPNDATVTQLALLFQPVRTPPANVVTALVGVGTAAQTAGYTNLDRWRFILLPMCTWSLNDLL